MMDVMGDQADQSSRWIVIALLLALVALVPRVYELGERSFWGDEETTALPSLAVASGHGPVMPSGMTYFRALPQTYLNAAVLQVTDQDSEASYRLGSALLGAVTVAVFFLFVRSFFGLQIALLASSLLLLSDWHITVSREGRMYGPFLLAYLVTAWATLSWVRSGGLRWLIGALVGFAFTISLHVLGLFVLMFALIPAALSIRQRASLMTCSVFFAGLALLGFFYEHWFVVPAASEWGPTGQIDMLPTVEQKAGGLPDLGLPVSGAVRVVFAIVGLMLGASIGIRLMKNAAKPNFVATLAIIMLSISGVVLASSGLIYGAACCMVALLFVVPTWHSWMDRRVLLPLLVAALLAAGWVAYACFQLGLIEGVKAVFRFPFPYLLSIGREMPGVALLAVLGCGAALLGDRPLRARYGIAVLAVLGPMLAIGVLSEWGGKRYLIYTYPFMLILAALGMWQFFRFLLRVIREDWQRFAVPVALVCIILGVDSGHGVPAALAAVRVNYEEFPDHRSAGYFVKERMLPSDIVVAEDVLQQKWYIGRADYWLRDPATHSVFMYYDEDRVVRDIYVASRVLMAADIDGFDAQGRRVWVITSAETANKPEYNMSDVQRKWLRRLQEDGPVYVGKDGVTGVYCRNCMNDGR